MNDGKIKEQDLTVTLKGLEKSSDSQKSFE